MGIRKIELLHQQILQGREGIIEIIVYREDEPYQDQDAPPGIRRFIKGLFDFLHLKC